MANGKPIINEKDRLYRFGVMFFLILSFFFIILSLKALKEYNYIGYDPASRSVITVNGEGEAFAVPDVAVFTFGVREIGKTVPEAQEKATTNMTASLKVLKGYGIDDKDIKTTSYYVTPQYDYSNNKPLICANGYCPPPSNPTLIGYEVNQTIEVKIRQSDKAGEIVSKVGAAGATNVSGIDFRVDDESKVQENARNLAIADAQQRASRQASALGVRLVRIVSFNESYGPMYYKSQMMSADGRGGMAEAVPAVPLPQGENKFSSNVQITYEIR